MGKFLLRPAKPNYREIDLDAIVEDGTYLREVVRYLTDAGAVGYYGYAVKVDTGKLKNGHATDGVLIYIPGARDLGEALTKENK